MLMIPRSVVCEIWRFQLSHALHQGIKRTPRKLPVKIRTCMHPTLHFVVVNSLEPQILNTTEEICKLLGIERQKTFELGSYAKIKASLEVCYDTKWNKTILKGNYAVYSQARVRQWPPKKK